MNKPYNIDLYLLIILTLISLVSVFIIPLNQFPIRVLPCFLMLFILPGYALSAILYPDKYEMGLIKAILLSIILSASITILFTLINISRLLNIPPTDVFVLLATFTVIMSLFALIKRKNIKRYIRCKRCNGYYLLKKGESIEDFEKCTCGGDLEYFKYISSKKADKKSNQFLSLDILVIILLTFTAIIIQSVPQLSNNVKIIIVPAILFLLFGYALTITIYPYKNTLTISKRFLMVIGFSIFTLFLSVISSVYSFKTPSIMLIFVLSILILFLTLTAFVRRFKNPKNKEKKKKYSNKNYIKENDTEIHESKGKINEFSSTNKFENYKSFKSTYIDLILVFSLTFLSIVSVLVPVINDSFIRTIFGFLFVLFLPGYALIAALFPKINDLDNIERVALSFGLSIAVAPLIGLALNYTPFGIRLNPILISLSIFTILMLFIAFLRRKKLPESDRFSININNFFKGVKFSFDSENKTDKILSIVLVASIIIAISATAYVKASPKEGEKFTEFYILGPSGKASDYPVNLTAGETGSVIIGIVNHEYSKTNYKMVIKLNNKTLSQQNITLDSNQKYENSFNFTASSGQKQKLEFLLYKLPDEDNAYRSLHLWINSK